MHQLLFLNECLIFVEILFLRAVFIVCSFGQWAQDFGAVAGAWTPVKMSGCSRKVLTGKNAGSLDGSARSGLPEFRQFDRDGFARLRRRGLC